MWVTNDNIWVCYVGSIALILFLYGVKAIALRHLRTTSAALLAFTLAVAACVPVTWALSPDWNNEFVASIAIYVGNPIATLGVPCLSFLIDLVIRSPGRLSGWHWRAPLEVFIAVPMWILFWVHIEAFVLGWVGP